MGCACSRDRTEQENTLKEAEEFLHLKKSCEFIYETFEKFATSSQFPEEEWELIKAALGFSNHPAVIKFFSSFKSIQGLYDLRLLLILGVILGQGTPALKAELLFKIIGNQACRQLEKKKIQKLIKHILCLTVDHLPRLVMQPDLKMVKYLTKIANLQETFLISFLAEFPNPTVSLTEFIKNTDLGNGKSLVEPYYLRKLIIANNDKDSDVTEMSDQNETASVQ